MRFVVTLGNYINNSLRHVIASVHTYEPKPIRIKIVYLYTSCPKHDVFYYLVEGIEILNH